MRNRWVIALAGVVMQIALGAVYAWSVFRIPLTKAFGWTIPQVTLTFTIAIFVLGFAAFAGGLWMRRAGPRVVAVAAGTFYGLGVFLASLTNGRLWWLDLSYGLLGGIGLGLGYIVPVATLVKWFPDWRGMITGIAVAGFGVGCAGGRAHRHESDCRRRPAADVCRLRRRLLRRRDRCRPGHAEPARGVFPARLAARGDQQQRVARAHTLGEAVRSWQWYGLWALLFLNTTAGIAIISQAAPMAQEIARVSADRAARLVGIIAIANGAGRFLWAWLSDFVGRRVVFLLMFPIQALVFFALPSVQDFASFTALACVILLCYGGGFGTMPAFAADYFGAEHVGSIYGLMLTAWGVAGVLGPTLIATLRQSSGHYDGALHVLAGLMLVSTVIPAILRRTS